VRCFMGMSPECRKPLGNDKLGDAAGVAGPV
jgi:hypothetical protein